MEIRYYTRANGTRPVEEFLRRLPAGDRVRVVAKIELLAEHGHRLDRPHAGTLRDGIRELRTRTNHGQYRILYFIFYRDTAVLLDGIRKTSRRVPDAAIERAIEYRQDYEQRHTKEQR